MRLFSVFQLDSDSLWRRQFGLYLALSLVLTLLGGWFVYDWTMQVGLADLRHTVLYRLNRYADILGREIERFSVFPLTTALNREVVAFLASAPVERDVDQMNSDLKQLAATIGISRAYLIDPAGRVVATSNWDRPDSFLGRDVSYRPYVRDAPPGHTIGFYGIGTTGDTPGYFLATEVAKDGRRLGVVAIKLDLEQLERPWRGAEPPLLLSDTNNVVVLSSNARWNYGTIGPMGASRQRQAEETQQYNHHELHPLVWQPKCDLGDGFFLVRFGDAAGTRDYAALTQPVPGLDMKFTVLSDTGATQTLAAARGLAAMVMIAFVCVLLHAFWLWRDNVRQRLATREALQAAYDRLEVEVEQRSAELRIANDGLRREVQERNQAVRQLQNTQEELIRTENLAVIGQLSAGLAHEINQPLAALGTLSANAVRFLERGEVETVRLNLSRIGDLVTRLGTLTEQLRSFARRSTGEAEILPVGPRVEAAQALLAHRLAKNEIRIVHEPAADPLLVRIEPVRLEQVLVNLISNAADALAGRAEKEIRIIWRRTDDEAEIVVADNGPGMSEDVLDRVFEPFFTTKKSSGLGLGLAISADVMQRLGGRLTAANRPDGGAAFTIRLPLAERKGPIECLSP